MRAHISYSLGSGTLSSCGSLFLCVFYSSEVRKYTKVLQSSLMMLKMHAYLIPLFGKNFPHREKLIASVRSATFAGSDSPKPANEIVCISLYLNGETEHAKPSQAALGPLEPGKVA